MQSNEKEGQTADQVQSMTRRVVIKPCLPFLHWFLPKQPLVLKVSKSLYLAPW